MSDYLEIREASDVTEAHIAEAMDCRSGLYGGDRLSWDETISRIEGYREDWGSSMESPAIRYLKREVNKRLREQES